MQTVCTSLQTDDHTNTSSLKIFYRPDALPDAHRTVVKALTAQRNTCCCPLSNMVAERRLRSFGQTTRSALTEGHHHAVAAAIHKPPSDWKRPPGRPNHTWLGVIKSDLRSLILVIPTRGRRQPLQSTGLQLWTRLWSREYAMMRKAEHIETRSIACGPRDVMHHLFGF